MASENTNTTVIIDVELNSQDATAKANDLGKSIAEIKKEQKELKDQGKENDAAYISNAQNLRLLTAEQKAYVQISNAAEGSNNQLRAQLALTTQQYNALSAAERDESVAGKALQIQIKAISDTLKVNESAVGDNRRNVGNYKEAIVSSKEALEEQKAALSASTLEQAKSFTGFKQFDGVIGGVTSQIKSVNEALAASKTAQVELRAAQQLTVTTQEAANVATQQATAIGFKFAAGEATAAEAEAARTAATNSQIVATAALTAETEAQTAATAAGTNAAKVFKIALASTGIGAIIIIVAALISYLSKFDPIMDKVEQAFAAVGAVVNRVTGIVVKFFSNLSSLGDFLEKIGGILADPIGSFQKLGDEMAEAATQAYNLKKAQQDLEDQMKIQEVSNARALQQVRELTIQARNRSLSEAERQKLLQKANQIDEDNFKKQQQIANEKKRIAIEDIKIQGDLTDAQVKRLDKEGLAYAFQLKDIANITDEQVDVLKDAELEKIKNEEETTNRREKNLNLQDQLAEKAAAAEEKRAAKREQQRQKEADAEQVRLESLVRTNESIQTTRKNDEDSLNREIDAKIAKYKQFSSVTKQLELERVARLKEIQDQYAKDIKASTDETLKAVEDLFISRMVNQHDRELAEIAVQNERKLAQQDQLIADTQARAALGEQGLTDLLLAQQQLRDELVTQGQFDIEQKNREHREQLAQEEIDRDQQVLAAKVKIQEEERKLTDQGLSLLEQVFGKETALGKAAFLAQKAFAIARVIIDTQQALAANRLAEQVANASLSAIPIIGIGLAIANSAKAQIERTKIIIGGAISAVAIGAAAVAGFNDGVIGFRSDGSGAMVKGAGTSKSDSINARLSNGESVINARSTKMFAPLLSLINQAGGGRPLAPGYAMAEGGFVSNISSSAAGSLDLVNAVVAGIKAAPAPIVDVRDITTAQQRQEQATVNANL